MLDLMHSKNTADALYKFLIIMLYILILTFFLRFLWNQSLVPHVTILKPVDSLWHTFLLAIAVAAFRC